MNKTNKNLNIIVIIVAVAIIAWVALDLFVLNGQGLSKKADNTEQESVVAQAGEPVDNDIFYWGDGCPHCQDVKDWMAEQKVSEKMEVISKEVYNNQANSQELTARAKSCGLDTQRIGVPFLYTIDGDCIIGTPKIIEYLSQKIAQ